MIKPLSKVSLILEILPEDKTGPHSHAKINFDFIYAIGTDGLTAFEKDIHQLSVDERIDLRVEPCQMQVYFEHLTGPLLEAMGDHPPFELRIGIRSIAPATDRELVRALANKDAGGACGCGCGC